MTPFRVQSPDSTAPDTVPGTGDTETIKAPLVHESNVMSETSNVERLQREHYDQISSDYAAHYGDAWSEKYRRRFINEPLLKDVPLAGAKVLDALCGSGETTAFLLERGAEVTGLDISQESMTRFQERYPGCRALCASVFSTGLESATYDCVVVVGGLHHLHPRVPDAVAEIHRLLKVGGTFCFMEPHTGSWPDRVRRFWYQRDKLFEENEAAIDLAALQDRFRSEFDFVSTEYRGGVGYLLVLNSLVFRIPLWIKPLYSPVAIGVESVCEKLTGRRLSCVVVCQWVKR